MSEEPIDTNQPEPAAPVTAGQETTNIWTKAAPSPASPRPTPLLAPPSLPAAAPFGGDPTLQQPAAATPAAPAGRRGRLLAAIAVTALVSSAIGAGTVALIVNDDDGAAVSVVGPAVNADGTASAAGGDVQVLSSRPQAALDTASIVAATAASVVSIHVTIAGSNVFDQQTTGEGTGTGFVATTGGLIYTNAHVVSDATSVKVTLADGTTHDGEVVGVDATDDLAVVRIDATGLQPLPIGSSADMRVGDPVVAVGNALALPGGPTATQGIVSALNRSIDTDNGEHLAKLIQTDAAINPGNSGGPLLNAMGEVIGINTAGATDAENVGFAIALDTAKPILEQLAQGKKVVKAFLGVQTQDVDKALVDREGLSVESGAYVVAVTDGSAAKVAGIEVGDVVTKIDDVDVTSSSGLGEVLRSHQPDDTVQVTVRRGDADKVLTANLGSREA